MYSVLSNKELQQQTLDMIERFRRYIAKERKLESQLSEQETQQMLLDPASATALGRRFASHRREREQRRLAAYESEFKVRLEIYRDEVFFRLPDKTPGGSDYTLDFSHYSAPTDFWGMEIVATNLEKLALHLPIKNRLRWPWWKRKKLGSTV